ncbi:MBL fold metallo-hydrolase [uncultured Halopseudomonas sp.]|uniref:MBL fold metallo-hydrolase n=1 Tax=uncultured Halopseudomonas sp. TaxID=2901193 RepID=UPI0030EE870F|tara:strand:- start:18295 stop:19281 length:987 start_codon:yes stop_codon:yes gene_type:complete
MSPKHPFIRSVGLAVAAGLTFFSCLVQAEPVPKQQDQVPGYYRMSLGEFEVTALYDGYVDLDPALLKGIDADNLQSLFTRMFVSADDGVQTAVNAYLVNTGTELILVDVGAAQCFGPTLGNIATNLQASGYAVEQVSMVLLTHLHPDHACGLRNSDGSATYPNATVHVPRAEAAYWLDEELAATMPDSAQPFFKMAQAAVEPYVAQKRLQQYGRDTELMPGVRTVPTNGHTPGHNAYLFQSEGQDLMVWGDIVHSHTVQFARPDVTIEFDVDSEAALATRKDVFNDAARNRFWVAGAHLPFPGLGHVRRDGAAFSWVPVEFGPLRSGQ